MCIVILKRGDYLEDIAINGRIDILVEGIFLGFVDCTHLALSRYKNVMFRKH
jgi:hypothetical protein